MKNSNTITIKNIATRSRVSTTSVSKVLHGYSGISDKLKKKVENSIKDLDYIPNYFSRALALNRSKLIGLLIPRIDSPIFSEIAEGVYDVAFDNGFQVITSLSQENPNIESKQITKLLSMQVEAILVVITDKTKDYSAFYRIKEKGIPLNFIYRKIEDESFNNILCDNYGIMYQIVDKEIKLGNRKIYYYSNSDDEIIENERIRGFKSALSKNSLLQDEELFQYVYRNEFYGNNNLANLYKTQNPNVIICSNLETALHIYASASKHEFQISGKLKIISFSDSIFNKVDFPNIDIIEQPVYEIGRTALEITLKNIQYKDSLITQTIAFPTNHIY